MKTAHDDSVKMNISDKSIIIKINNNTEKLETNNNRNYSFLNKNDNHLDIAEDKFGNEYTIPASVGTTYWAILKFCYSNANTHLLIDDIIDGTAEILEDRDYEKFNNYKNKSTVKTMKNGEVIVKNATSWRKRIENNVKTLTRYSGKNPYGLRLIEKGHILRIEKIKGKNKKFYILRTDTNEPIIFRNRKKKEK